MGDVCPLVPGLRHSRYRRAWPRDPVVSNLSWGASVSLSISSLSSYVLGPPVVRSHHLTLPDEACRPEIGSSWATNLRLRIVPKVCAVITDVFYLSNYLATIFFNVPPPPTAPFLLPLSLSFFVVVNTYPSPSFVISAHFFPRFAGLGPCV